MTLLLQYMLMFASVLLLVALGGCFSEHSGVINIGLEGIMVFGALGGALMMKYMPDGTAVVVVILLTTLMAMIFGMQPFILFFYSACDVNKTVVCGVRRCSSLRRRAYVESLI